MGDEVVLDLPKGVRVTSLMTFLERGHGYTWRTVSKEPVLMVLGHPLKGDHPEVVIVRDTLVVNTADETMRGRMEMMLDVLKRQAQNGHGGKR